MSYNGHGMNKKELMDAGLKNEDGEPIPEELVSEEAFNAWRERGKGLLRQAAQNQWEIGEWIVEGEELKELAGWMGADQRFKNSIYKAAAAEMGRSVTTVKGIAFVYRNISSELRAEFKLSFAHFKLVASPEIDVEKKRSLLRSMEAADESVEDARNRVRVHTGAVPEKKSRADNRALRIIRHCNHVLAELDNYNLEAMSPPLRDQMLSKVEITRGVLEFVVGCNLEALV